MGILVVILKIVGAALAVLLLLAVLVTAVPVRYAVDAVLQDRAEGKAAVGWLFHLLDLRVSYGAEGVSYRFRVFGIPILPGRKRGKRGGGGEGSESSREAAEETPVPAAEERETPVPAKKAAQIGEHPIPAKAGGETPASAEKAEDESGASSPAEKTAQIGEHPVPAKAGGETPSLPEAAEEESGASSLAEKAAQIGEHPIPAKAGGETPSLPEAAEEESGAPVPKKKRRRRARFAWKWLRGKPGKGRRRGKGKKPETGRTSGIRNLLAQARRLEETDKNAFRCLLRELRRLFFHYAPRKASGKVAFAMQDPSQTGLVCGAASLLPFWARYRIQMEPDFSSDVFYVRGSLRLKGHIRIVHLLTSLIRLVKEKVIREVIKKIRK